MFPGKKKTYNDPVHIFMDQSKDKDYFNSFRFDRGGQRDDATTVRVLYNNFLRILSNGGYMRYSEVSLPSVRIRDKGQTRRETVFKQHQKVKVDVKPREDTKFSTGRRITLLLPRLFLRYRYRLVDHEFKKPDDNPCQDVKDLIDFVFKRLKMMQALLQLAWVRSHHEERIRLINGPQTHTELEDWYLTIFYEADRCIKHIWNAAVEYDGLFRPSQHKILTNVRFVFQNFGVQISSSLMQMNLNASLIQQNRLNNVNFAYRKHKVFKMHFRVLQKTLQFPKILMTFMQISHNHATKVVSFDYGFFTQVFFPMVNGQIQINPYACSFTSSGLNKCQKVFDKMELPFKHEFIFKKTLFHIRLHWRDHVFKFGNRLSLVNRRLSESDEFLAYFVSDRPDDSDD